MILVKTLTRSFLSILFISLLAFGFSKTSYAFDLLPISIVSVDIDQSKTYSAGQSILGSFLVQSAADKGVAYDLKYNIALIEGGTPGKPSIIYDRTSLSDIRIEAGDTRSNFKYTIPQSLPAGRDFSIQVQFFRPDGTPLNWSYSAIKIAEGTASNTWVEIKNPTIFIGKERYGLGDGPTIYESGNSFLTFEATKKENQTKDNFYFRYKINEFSSVEKIVNNDSVPVPFIGGKAAFKMELPFLSPGIYTGVGAIYDEKNQKKSRDITFKYIIDGDLYKIRDFSLSTLQSGSVSVSGKPIDTAKIIPEMITASSVPDVLTFSASVLDDEGNEIANTRTNIDVGTNDKKNIPIPLNVVNNAVLKKEGYITAKLSLSRGNKIINTYEQNISLPLSVENFSSDVKNINLKDFVLRYSFFLLVFLIIAILTFWVLRYFIGPEKARVVSIVLFVLLLAMSIFLLKSVYAKTTKLSNYMEIVQSSMRVLGIDGVLDPTVTYFLFQTDGKNARIDNQYGYMLNAGQKFDISVGIFSWRCLNRYHAFLAELFTDTQKSKGEGAGTVPGQAGQNYYAPENHPLADYQSNSSYGTFTAPETPGFYKVTYDIENMQYSTVPWSNYGAVSYNRTEVVRDFETNQTIFNRSDYHTYWLVVGKTTVTANFVVLCPDGSLPINSCVGHENLGNSFSSTTSDTTNVTTCRAGYAYNENAHRCVSTACIGSTNTNVAFNPITGECYCINNTTDVPYCTKIIEPLDCVLSKNGGNSSGSVKHGQKIKMYEKSIVGQRDSCEEHMAELTCFNGVLYKPPFTAPEWDGLGASVSGETNADAQYKYSSCRIAPGYNEI